MRIAKTLLASAAVTAALGSTSALADDWTGGYIGVYGEGTFISIGAWAGAPGFRAGYNFDMGGFVLGVEGSVEWYPSFGGFGDLQATVRLGVDLGPAFLYSAFGGGWITLAPAPYWTIGTGLEVMVTDSIALRADYKFKVIPGGGPVSHNFSGGISYYFGR